MKHFNRICVLFFILISISAAGYSQNPGADQLGLPGDNLNLYGVLALFKQSNNVQDFEQRLNDPNNKVNNLDLNNDGQIDYIRVVDYGNGGTHSLVLQDPVTPTESQDLAVLEIEQRGDGVAHIQIVGDESLYGKNYIIEPENEQQPMQMPPPTNNYNPTPPMLINVWGWPSIQFMFSPRYTYWNSPYYYGYYPGWWSPWRPFAYQAYWYNMYGYRSYQRRVYYNHMMGAHDLYYGHRMVSPTVHGYIRSNAYNGPRGEGPRGEGPGGRRDIGPGGNNQPHVVGGGREGGGREEGSGRPANNFNNQPRQESAPRQQVAPRPEAPRNMGGGGGRPSGGGGGGRRR